MVSASPGAAKSPNSGVEQSFYKEEEPLREPKLGSKYAAAPKKKRKRARKLQKFEVHSADNPSSLAYRYKGALMAFQFPSYCLKTGVGYLPNLCARLRPQHQARLFRLLSHLLRQQNWAEASGVLSVLLLGTIKDRSISGNRAKYTAALELLSVIKGENLISKRVQKVYELWMMKIGSLKKWLPKDRFAVRLELILDCLQRGSLKEACQTAKFLMQDRDFAGDPVANLVVGLAFYQLWYSDIPKEFQWTKLDSSGSYVPSETPNDAFHMFAKYSEEDNPHEAGGTNYVKQCDSNTSVAKDKEVAEDDSNQHNLSTDIETKEKKGTSYYSSEPEDLCEKSVEEHHGISGSSNYSGDFPHASIFLTQGLPPWLLPMKLPSSDESLEDAARMHRNLLNDHYKVAVKHLRIALHATPPAIEAIHPLIQMLILGDQVHEALAELGTLCQSLDTVLQLRLQASLLEHFDRGNYVKLCTCFEDILKKDPACSDSLSRLVLMHQLGEYDTQSLVEMIALHLDASYGTCDMWQEFASCLLKLSHCEGDRESACYSGSDPDEQGSMGNLNRVPELLTCGESGKGWRLRSRWWLNRHFHNRILMSEIASGDLKLLTYKAAAASHIYGRHFNYVVKTTESLEKLNDMELYSFLQTHLLNSVGFCIVEGRN